MAYNPSKSKSSTKQSAHRTVSDQGSPEPHGPHVEGEVWEAKYHILFASVPLPIMVYDVDTLEFIAVNHATVAQYGYSVDEFAKMTVKDIRPDDEVSGAVALIRSLPDGPYPKIQAIHRRRGGSAIRVEIASHSLPIPGRRARLAVIQTIADQVEACGPGNATTAPWHDSSRNVVASREAPRQAIRLHSPKDLSTREREILCLVAHGFTNQQVGDRLAISVKSVETYRRRVMDKLALGSRVDLVRYALTSGLLAQSHEGAVLRRGTYRERS